MVIIKLVEKENIGKKQVKVQLTKYANILEHCSGANLNERNIFYKMSDLPSVYGQVRASSEY